jgi:hypothetical protein
MITPVQGAIGTEKNAAKMGIRIGFSIKDVLKIRGNQQFYIFWLAYLNYNKYRVIFPQSTKDSRILEIGGKTIFFLGMPFSTRSHYLLQPIDNTIRGSFMSENDTVNRLTVLDWIGIVYVVVNIIALFFFPKIAFSFEKMFEDFGGPLPALTIIVLKPWFSILLGIFCTGIFSLQWIKPIKISLKRRRTVIVLSIITASTAYAICIIGLYKPIFNIAGSIG